MRKQAHFGRIGSGMMDQKVSGDAFFWALQGVCALHRKPYSDALARQQLAAPYTTRSLLDAMQAYGFDAVHTTRPKPKSFTRKPFR